MKLYLLSALVAFAISFLFCKLLIPVLRKVKAGQNILSYVKEHKSKSGTPTMGGLAFISATVLAVALCVRRAEPALIISVAVGLAYMLIGLLDDFLKRKHKQNLGLKAWQKFAFQALVAAFSGAYCVRAGLTELQIPLDRKSTRLNSSH